MPDYVSHPSRHAARVCQTLSPRHSFRPALWCAALVSLIVVTGGCSEIDVDEPQLVAGESIGGKGDHAGGEPCDEDAHVPAEGDPSGDDTPAAAEAHDITLDDVDFQVVFNNELAMDMLHRMPEDDNAVLSALSVSSAMAMLRAGARGETGSEIDRVFKFWDGEDGWSETKQATYTAAIFGTLHDQLTSLTDPNAGTEFSIAVDVWLEQSLPVESAFVVNLAEHMDAVVNLLDFVGDPNGARDAINDEVSQHTGGRIDELIPTGVINSATRFALTNAMVLTADWRSPFESWRTQLAPFHAPGGTVDVETMGFVGYGDYYSDDHLEVVRRRFADDRVVAYFALPRQGMEVEAPDRLSRTGFKHWERGFEGTHLGYWIPKFSLTASLRLDETLQAMGMTSVWSSATSDLTGITTAEPLFLQAVVHEVTVEIDESGFDGAAATAVIGGTESLPPTQGAVNVRFDRPFYFFVVDLETNSALFSARVVDPS